MSDANPPTSSAPATALDAGDGVTAGAAHHDPYLAHHFHSRKQQFTTEKLGIWVFLATEILMFGGLFCLYAYYRGLHPEIFLYGHQFLPTHWGAINTAVLLTSSLTMAWGVRAAQVNAQGMLKVMLLATLLGGLGFMVIKGIEYTEKFTHALGPGPGNVFYPVAADDSEVDAKLEQKAADIGHLEAYYGIGDHAAHGGGHADHGGTHAGPPHADAARVEASRHDAPVAAPEPRLVVASLPAEAQSLLKAPAAPVAGVDAAYLDPPESAAHASYTFEALPEIEQDRMHMFFQIYYLMTGLHGIHVLVGMGLIGWLVWRAFAGAFSPNNFVAVDVVGLYWHLVDLIWIFLFPLLYLIH